MVDILKRVEETLEKGMTVWVESPDVEGFEIEIAYVGREEMTKIYNRCTQRKWNRQTRRMEEVTNRDKLMGIWSERAIKDWKGLTLKSLISLVPIVLGKEDKPASLVECTEGNKVALLKHNADFDNFILDIATNSEVFMQHRREADAEVKNLTQ